MKVMERFRRPRVAVLALCDLTRAGLEVLLTALGAEVIAVTSAATLRDALRVRAVADMLVADAGHVEEAIALAREHRLPLLVIAPTLGRGLAIAGDVHVTGVLTFPVAQSALSDALETIAIDERYLPFDPEPDLTGAQLSTREQEIVALDLQHVATEEIAQWMGVEVATTYSYRSRIRRKLRRLEPSEQPEWAAAWLGLFSGPQPRRG